MLGRHNLRQRIDDALAVASPLALAQATDTHIAHCSPDDLRTLIKNSVLRMEPAELEQLGLYVDPGDEDDVVADRFSAFLQHNPRAIAALDPHAVIGILTELGEVAPVEHPQRKLSAQIWGVVAVALVLVVLPLGAQYAHQLSWIQRLDALAPAPIVPFVQRIALRRAPSRPSHAHHVHPRVHAAPRTVHVAQHRTLVPVPHAVAYRPRHVSSAPPVAWKFDRQNNPYFNRLRWKHPYVTDAAFDGDRARVSVHQYLHALVVGNLGEALGHLGLPRTAATTAISELPIVRRNTRVTIVGSKRVKGGAEDVQADIVTGTREYYEVFHVTKDGPAIRIADRYYIPVNRPAVVAERSLIKRRH